MSITDKLKNLLATQSATNTASQQVLGQPGNATFTAAATNTYTYPTSTITSTTGNTGSITVRTGNFGSLSATQLGSLLAGYGTPLTPEEKVEYDELKKEHEFKLKLAKLDIFKQLPADIRQLVINSHLWQACCNDMNSTVVDKDPKLEELELRDNSGKLYTSSGSGNVWISSGTSIFGNYYTPTLPTGITVDDLKQAHMEATLEEQVLDGETNE